MEVRRQIDVTKDVREDIKAAFKCSKMGIWRALTYANDTNLSKRIRKYALLKGGVELLILPATETIHDCKGCMRQYFQNGAMIEVDKKEGTVALYDRAGKLRLTQHGAKISEFEKLQELAKTF